MLFQGRLLCKAALDLEPFRATAEDAPELKAQTEKVTANKQLRLFRHVQ